MTSARRPPPGRPRLHVETRMARLAKGKEGRGRRLEYRRFGTLLTRDEVDGPSVMLTGYRRFDSEAAAEAALRQEVARAIAEGLAPVDDEAKEIAAALPAAKADGPPELPIRRDVYVYNEATGFMVTSRRMAGKHLEEGTKAWVRAVDKGDMLPVVLF